MTERKLVDMAVEAYVAVMGADKWNNLSEREQHDVIMILLKDFNNRLEVME